MTSISQYDRYKEVSLALLTLDGGFSGWTEDIGTNLRGTGTLRRGRYTVEFVFMCDDKTINIHVLETTDELVKVGKNISINVVNSHKIVDKGDIPAIDLAMKIDRIRKGFDNNRKEFL